MPDTALGLQKSNRGPHVHGYVGRTERQDTKNRTSVDTKTGHLSRKGNMWRHA